MAASRSSLTSILKQQRMAYEETRLSAIQEVKDKQRKKSEKMKALEEENSKEKASSSVARKSTTARRPGTSQATSRMSGYQDPEEEQQSPPKFSDSNNDEDLLSGRLTALRGLQKRDSATKATAAFSKQFSTDDEDDLSSLFDGDLNVSIDEDELQVENTLEKTIFDIAPEQRTDIFEYYLITRSGIHIPAQPPYVREPALLAVSKQVRAEVTPIWYSENTFVSRFTGDITRWLDSLDPARLSMLTWVNLETTLPAGFVLPGLREMNKRVKDGLKENVVAVTVAVEKEETFDAYDQNTPHVDNLKGGRERYELVTMDDVWKYNNLDGGWKTLHTKPKSTLRNVTERDPGAEPMEGVESTAAEGIIEDDSDVDPDSDDEDFDDESSGSDDSTVPWEYVELTEEQYKNIRHITQTAATENDDEKPRHATEDGNKEKQHLQAQHADKSFLPRESLVLGEQVSQVHITATASPPLSPALSRASSFFAPSPSSPKGGIAASSPAPSKSSSFAPSPSSPKTSSPAAPSPVSSKTISPPPRPPNSIKLNIGSVAPRASRGRKQSLTDDPTKIFGCDICGRHFRRQEHLKRHRQSLHTDDKPFECPVCQKAFSRADNLTQHRLTHRKDSLGSLGWAKSSGLLSEEMVFSDEDDDPVRTGTQRGRKAIRD